MTNHCNLKMSSAKAGDNVMTNAMRRNVLPCLMIAVGLGLPHAVHAEGYTPVTQQAQSKLATLGHDPGPLDGIAGGLTKTGVLAFQKKSGVPETGVLDAATLEKLGIGISVDKVNAVV